jgi:hypothetical protein
MIVVQFMHNLEYFIIDEKNNHVWPHHRHQFPAGALRRKEEFFRKGSVGCLWLSTSATSADNIGKYVLI